MSDFNDKSLQIYLKDINKIPLLSSKQEKELAERIVRGDKKALDELIKGNLRFVVNIAKAYQGKGLSLNELITEGNYGLIKAAQKFNPAKNVKFISYAVWWIRHSIMKAVLENTGNIRMPISQINKVSRIHSAQKNLSSDNGEMPSIKEIAQTLNISENEVRNAIRTNKKEISLNAPLSNDENLYLSDTIIQKQFLSPEESFLRKRYKEVLSSQLDKLNERETFILKQYFGLDDNRPHTLEEIGRKLNISRERVRQIKENAIKRLRNLSKGKLDIYRGNI